MDGRGIVGTVEKGGEVTEEPLLRRREAREEVLVKALRLRRGKRSAVMERLSVIGFFGHGTTPVEVWKDGRRRKSIRDFAFSGFGTGSTDIRTTSDPDQRVIRMVD